MMKLPSSFDSTGAQFAWDSTSLKSAFECPRKYLYEMIFSYVDPQKSVHLIFGGHYARAIETYHKLVIAEGATHDEATLAVVRQTMIESWVHNRTKEGERKPGTGHPELFNSTSKTRENLIRTIVWYLEEFRDSGFATYVKADGSPAVEFSFKLEVDNNIILCGHMDRVVQESSSLFVQDQKTTGGTVSSHSFKAYDLDIQMSLYTFAGRAILSSPIKGVMLDIAQVAVGFSRFMRGFTYRSEAQLEEWYQQIMAKIAEVRTYSQRFAQSGSIDEFPMNYTACGNYGGCPFRDVCSTLPNYREKYAEANLSKRPKPWNPLEER